MAKEASYTDPLVHAVLPKIAVVIPVYIPENPVKNYGHFKEDKAETILLNLRAHEHFNAGVEYDIILVDRSPVQHYVTDQTVQVLRMPNIGFSFGAYVQAWRYYGGKYDFYLFAEDDIVPTKDNWLADILLRFMSDKNIGALGNFVELRSKDETQSELLWKIEHWKRDSMYNLDGAFTFTSAKILAQTDQFGGLVFVDCEPNTKIPATINECIFQRPILELGYKIDSYADGKHFLVHGSEIFTNDLMYRTGPMAPLININGRHKVPEIAALYEQIIKEEHV